MFLYTEFSTDFESYVDKISPYNQDKNRYEMKSTLEKHISHILNV